MCQGAGAKVLGGKGVQGKEMGHLPPPQLLVGGRGGARKWGREERREGTGDGRSGNT